jgi:hypothetical protein
MLSKFTNMFIAGLFAIVTNRKYLTSLIAIEWANVLLCSLVMNYYMAVKINDLQLFITV